MEIIKTTALKNTFKGIYGQFIGNNVKEYRIRHAAVLLCQIQAAIAEIISQAGYKNQSRFAGQISLTGRLLIKEMPYQLWSSV